MSEVSKEQILEEAQHLQGMIQSPGWKVLVDEANTRKESLLKALVHSDDIDTIRGLQANIRSLEFLLKFPLEIMETANRVTEAEKAP